MKIHQHGKHDGVMKSQNQDSIRNGNSVRFQDKENA